jgi:hypothetical protein
MMHLKRKKTHDLRASTLQKYTMKYYYYIFHPKELETKYDSEMGQEVFGQEVSYTR